MTPPHEHAFFLFETLLVLFCSELFRCGLVHPALLRFVIVISHRVFALAMPGAGPSISEVGRSLHCSPRLALEQLRILASSAVIMFFLMLVAITNASFLYALLELAA